MAIDINLLLQLTGIIVSLVVSMLFATTDRKILRTICLCILFGVGITLSVGLYHSAVGFLTKAGIIAFGIVYTTLIGFGFASMKTTLSATRMNKRVHQFTELAATSSTIKIYGGDINFFGNYDTNDPTNGIAVNTVYKQLKSLERRNIQVNILCKRPQTQGEKMRIGYLATNLKNVQFGFYSTRAEKCIDCEFENQCKELTCEDSYRLKYCCEKMRNSCPDLKFRGRIITQNNNASYVLVTNWIEPNKVYKRLMIYKPDSRECNFYLRLWDVLWNNAQRYKSHTDKIVEECKKLITNF